MTTMKCARPDCSGAIEDGYCNSCGLAPIKAPGSPKKVAESSDGGFPSPSLSPAPSLAPSEGVATIGGTAVPSASSPASAKAATLRTRSGKTPTSITSITSTTLTGSSKTRTGATRRSGFGGGLVTVPNVPIADPASVVLADPSVPEKDRYCAKCNEKVGRAKGTQPGREKGFCASCRNPFDFNPKLAPGELVGGQYEVAGCIAHGGYGWIYLARDRNVSNRWVVLKGTLDSGNEDARAAALAERRFLAAIEHPEIVKIFNFVAHQGAEYIVMEYIGGKSLKNILKERRDLNNGLPDPLPLEQSLAYMIEILPAISYLHEHGYIFCDFKPDNVIHQDDHLKLIDLGGVRSMNDPDGNVYGTVGFQAPEIAQDGPSISSDLYTVARTLAVLSLDFKGYTSEHKFGAPIRSDHPVLGQFDSFYRMLLRGTAESPDLRFQTVEELSDQLKGILREVVAITHGKPCPGTSQLFTSDRLASRGTMSIDARDWRMLPIPLVSADDPSADFLVNLSTTPEMTVAAIDAAVASRQIEDSVETRLRRLRSFLDIADVNDSKSLLALTASFNNVRQIAPNDWRIRWYEALACLLEKKFAQASDYFDEIASWLPGELAPRTALAFALERIGDVNEAAALYDRVSKIDESQHFASFGLGRCRTAQGDRAGAVEAYSRVPATSILHQEAGFHSAAAHIDNSTRKPTVQDFTDAADALKRLEIAAEKRIELAHRILLSALEYTQQQPVPAGATLFDSPFTERSVRLQLERNFRTRAAQASDPTEKVRLIDEANAIRPVTTF